MKVSRFPSPCPIRVVEVLEADAVVRGDGLIKLQACGCRWRPEGHGAAAYRGRHTDRGQTRRRQLRRTRQGLIILALMFRALPSRRIAMTQSALINVIFKASEKAARGLVRDFGEVENSRSTARVLLISSQTLIWMQKRPSASSWPRRGRVGLHHGRKRRDRRRRRRCPDMDRRSLTGQPITFTASLFLHFDCRHR